MVNPVTTSIAPTFLPGDSNLSRLAPLQKNGAQPSTVTARPQRIAQNVATGGSAFGKGNIRFTSGPVVGSAPRPRMCWFIRISA
jgi:hypothetical protein